jgi:hypothetical protein
MKTNTVTKLPKMAFGLGAGVLLTVLTMSSFKAEKKFDTHLWGKQSTGVWTNIDGVAQDATFPYASNSYRCNSSSNSCTIEAETQPANGSNPTGATLGAFVYTP